MYVTSKNEREKKVLKPNISLFLSSQMTYTTLPKKKHNKTII